MTSLIGPPSKRFKEELERNVHVVIYGKGVLRNSLGNLKEFF